MKMNMTDIYTILKYFLELMSYNIPDDVKKNKFLINMQTFQMETEDFLVF